MKIFTRVFLGILSLGLVLGSQAATLGVVPCGLPVSARTAGSSKSDTLFQNWRTPAALTVTDLGIVPVLNFPAHNPNVKKYSPLQYFAKKSGVSSDKPGVQNAVISYISNSSRVVAVGQGTREAKLIPSLTAYPNPSRGVTKISLNFLGDDNYKIRISNAIGKVYKEIPVTQPSVTETIVVDLSPFPAGMYFYSLLVNEKLVETKRLILQQQ